MKIFKIARKYGPAFFGGFVFALLCFIGLNAAMLPTSKPEYCADKCHEMKEAYRSWELSVHGTNKSGVRIGCVDCHLPPKDKYFSHVTVKAYKGAKDIYLHHFGDEYDAEEIRQKVIDGMPSKSCLNCHDNLLAGLGSVAARIAHTASLENPDLTEYRCVVCHENAGHAR